MNNKQIKKLVMAAVFCALIFAMTSISIPAPTVGNINLGDCVILLSAYMLGGPYAVAAAACGASLCDVASSYVIYAPGTFVIKGLMVLVMLMTKKYVMKGNQMVSFVISAICGEITMIFGYLVYEALILGMGVAAFANIPFNAIQGVSNLIVAIVFFSIFEKNGIIRMIRSGEEN